MIRFLTLLLPKIISQGIMEKCTKDQADSLKHNLSFNEPIAQFSVWLKEACSRKDITHPSAMCLATVSKDGIPSARFVILKSYDDTGFTFFTDYRSRKAQDIAENFNVAATFYWDILNRSVRIEGKVEKVSVEESNKQFYAWPLRSQLGASASHMSRGGYLIRPSVVEFWQGQKERLSDRIRFRKLETGEKPDDKILHQGEKDWVYERLSP